MLYCGGMLYIEPKILEKIKSYCAYQERCHSEVRYKLIDLGVRGEELEHIIGLLIEENFLNEERYAKAIVHGKLHYKHWGRRKIIQFLKSRDVSEYCIQAGLREIDEEDYRDILLQIAQKKAARLESGTPAFERHQKIIQYMVQKGFEVNLVREIVKDNIE